MLYERITEAVGKIDTVAELKNKEKASDIIVRNNNAFFDGVAVLSGIISTCSLVRCRFGFAPDQEQKKNIGRWCKYTRETFEKCTAYSPFEFRKSVKEISDQLDAAWQQFISEHYSDIRDELIIYRTVAFNKQEVNLLLTQLRACDKWSGLTPEKVEKYFEARKNAEGLLQSLNLDDEILSFLKLVNGNQATLSDLSPNVYDWLKKEELTGSIALSIKI